MPQNALTRRILLGSAPSVLGGCTAAHLVDALTPSATYRVRLTVDYGSDPRQRMDVYLPQHGAAAAPVVVFFYGGSWTRGERGDYRFVGEALASAGIVTVVADYRLSPQVRWTEILQDCASAAVKARAMAGEWGGSPDRMFLMGHSAGAYNASMLALDPRWLSACGTNPAALAGWIGIAGPYNFLPIGDPDTRVAFDWPSTPLASQPTEHVTHGAPRCLLLAARNDTTVDPFRNTAALAQRLREAGDPVESALVDHVSHVTIIAALAAPLRFLAPVRRMVVDFIMNPG